MSQVCVDKAMRSAGTGEQLCTAEAGEPLFTAEASEQLRPAGTGEQLHTAALGEQLCTSGASEQIRSIGFNQHGSSNVVRHRPAVSEPSSSSLLGRARAGMEGKQTKKGEQPSMSTYSRVKAFIRVVLILINTLYMIPTYMISAYLLWPLSYLSPHLYLSIEQRAFEYLQTFAAYWSYTAGYEVDECGDDVYNLLATSQCLLIANHQSTSDVLLLFQVTTDPNKRPLGQRICWIMAHLFKYSPFGWVCTIHGDAYIKEGREARLTLRDELEKHLKKYYLTRDRTCVMLFPEGGFLHKRRAVSQEYSRKHGYPILEHVTIPRVGAMETILSTLAPATNNNATTSTSVTSGSTPHSKTLQWIIDATIAYPNGGQPLDFATIILGSRPPCRTVVHYRKYSVSDVPRETEQLQQWLNDRWVEKEALLDEYYKTGTFPTTAETDVPPPTLSEKQSSLSLLTADSPLLRPVHVSSIRAISLNILFILSFYIQYRMFMWVSSIV